MNSINNSIVIIGDRARKQPDHFVPSMSSSEEEDTDSDEVATEDWESSSSESDETPTQSDIDFIASDDDEYIPPCCKCSARF
jgi:hypothetical protein